MAIGSPTLGTAPDPSFGSILSSALSPNPGGATPKVNNFFGSAINTPVYGPPAPTSGGGGGWEDYLKQAGWLGANLVAPFGAFTPGGNAALPTTGSLKGLGENLGLGALNPGLFGLNQIASMGQGVAGLPGVSGAYNWLAGLLGFGGGGTAPPATKLGKPVIGPIVGGQKPGAKGTTPATAGTAGGTSLQDYLNSIKVPSIGATQIAMPQGTMTLPGAGANTKLEQALLAAAMRSPRTLQQLLPGATSLLTAGASPLIKSILASGLAGANTITQYGRGTQAALGNIAGAIGSDYDNAIAVQRALSGGIGKSLASLNPQLEDSNILQNAGAPQGALQNVQNQDVGGFVGGGDVLSGIGNLAAGSLEAQKAAAMGFARTLPLSTNFQAQQALAAQSMGTGNALAKVYSQIGPGAIKLALGEQSNDLKLAQTRSGIAKNLMTNDASIRSAQVSSDNNIRNAQTRVAVANASNDTKARIAASNNYYKAVSAGINAYKATHPNVTTSASNLRSIATHLSNMASGSPGSVSETRSKNPAGQVSSSKTISGGKPGASYGAALAYARNALKGQPGATEADAEDLVNTVYSQYGYGGRPLDPPALQTLQAANIPTRIGSAPGPDKAPIYYLTEKQGLALLQAHTAPPMREYKTPQGTVEYILNVG